MLEAGAVLGSGAIDEGDEGVTEAGVVEGVDDGVVEVEETEDDTAAIVTSSQSPLLYPK